MEESCRHVRHGARQHHHRPRGHHHAHSGAHAAAHQRPHAVHAGEKEVHPGPDPSAKEEKKAPSPFCIDKEKINELPLGGFSGPIFLAYTQGAAERAAHELLSENILGFDTETKPNFKKGQKQNPIALIQLSTMERAFLFRVNETGMTPTLRKVLESPHILKIGQALKYELLTMKRELHVTGRGFLDLLDVAHKLECEPKSVKATAAIFLGVRISKSMQVTNWEGRVLSEKQKRYAATDAWACLAVYREIGRRGLLRKIGPTGMR